MTLHWKVATLPFVLSVLIAFSQEPGRVLDLSQYIARLDQLSIAVEDSRANPEIAPRIAHSLPRQWIVWDGKHTYIVSCGWLEDSLKKFALERSEENRRSVQDRISFLRAGAQAMQSTTPAFSEERKSLGEILAQREFKNVHSPSAWDRLTQKLSALLQRFLMHVFGSSSFPAITNIAGWFVVSIAIVFLSIWIFSTLGQNARIETARMPGAAPPSTKPWDIWIEEANAAAASACWRDAVRLAYWAGISFLESNGMWRPNRARTPREYLGLLSTSSQHHGPLTSLTRLFESVWYGYGNAGPESFSESMKLLEHLGCRSN